MRYGQQFVADLMLPLLGVLIAGFLLSGLSWFLLKSQYKRLKKRVILSCLALLIIVVVGLPVLISWSLPPMRY